MDAGLIIAFVALGAAVGFLAGLLGIGGGMTMVPLLTIVFGREGFAPDHIVHMGIATATTTIQFTSISSAREHHRHGAVVWSDLLSTDAVKVKPGAPDVLEQWGGDHPIRARVRRVEPAGFMKVSALGVEEQRVNVVMDFEDPLEAWSALGDGYRVEVRVVVWEGDGVLKAPTSSLFRRGEDWAVFTVERGRAQLRAVELGRRNGTFAEVVSGLREGEPVVLQPSDTLSGGARVTPGTGTGPSGARRRGDRRRPVSRPTAPA